MTASIFLDWFGVLADNDLMTRRWRIVEAGLLSRRFGGRVSMWTSVHDRAFKWYLDFWKRTRTTNSAGYRKLWKSCEVEWIRRTLSMGGVEAIASEQKLFRLDRELTYEVTKRIDAAHPSARETLKALRRPPNRLFLVSGADSVFVKGALEAAGLEKFFEDTFSPDSLDAFKGSPRYWKKILRESHSEPESSIVVDDRPKFLVTPARLGLRPILIGQRADRRFETLKSIGQLAPVVANRQVLRRHQGKL